MAQTLKAKIKPKRIRNKMNRNKFYVESKRLSQEWDISVLLTRFTVNIIGERSRKKVQEPPSPNNPQKDCNMMHNQFIVSLWLKFTQHDTRVDLTFPSALLFIIINIYFSFWKHLQQGNNWPYKIKRIYIYPA